MFSGTPQLFRKADASAWAEASSRNTNPKLQKLTIPSQSPVPRPQTHLPSPITPNGLKTPSSMRSEDSLTTRSSTTTSSNSINSAVSAPKNKPKYRSSFSTRKNMHQARQQQELRNKASYLLSKTMSSKTSFKRTQSVFEAQWSEKMRIKSELSKRIKARLQLKGVVEEGDRLSQIDDSEDEDHFEYEVDEETDDSGTNQQFEVQEPGYYSYQEQQRQVHAPSQLPPIICEQPPTPPTMSLPLSYRENLDWMNHQHSLQSYYSQHQFGFLEQPQQFYYPTTAVPPPSPMSITQPRHYPMHTVVVYQYGPPPQHAPFLNDPMFHQQVYPTPQQQHPQYFAQNQTLYMPPQQQQQHQEYPPLQPSISTTSGTLSSTLTRSPQFLHSQAVWLGPTSQSNNSPHRTNNDTTISGLLKPMGDDGVKIISRSSSSISIGALIDSPGGCENTIFGLQAL
ncbi:UNVERIFIED_CONTAM: hypothetical protein HDU68_012187 [Siphonaria sp. JEL0065]|nr:hypothetical protein HDU68_012187 [Siphonaria sp. JEL0065]